MEESPLGQGRIEYYVPVVGHGQILALSFEIIYALVGETGRCRVRDSRHHLAHNLLLEIIDAGDVPQDLSHRVGRKIGEQIFGDDGKGRMMR